MYAIICRTMIAAVCLFAGTVFAVDPIDYPDGYRQWVHVKSMVIHEGHALENPFRGIHHVYANPKALSGLQSDKYENGSILVFDLLAYNTADNASIEGERALLGVMVKDQVRFPKTAGWGYQGWAGNSHSERLVKDGGKSCHACHTQQSERDFVFSDWRE